MKNKLAYPEEGGRKYSETLPTNYKGTRLHIPEDCKLHQQKRENLKPKSPRLVIL
jgi:hypothetical protein